MVREYSFEQRFSTLFWVAYLERVEDREVHGTLLLNKLRRYIQNRHRKQGYWSWNTWGHQLPPLLGLCFSHYVSIGIFPESTHAMERLVKRNLDRNSRGQNMAIMTDSQAAIRALESPKINSIKMVWKHQSKLNDLGRKHQLPSCG